MAEQAHLKIRDIASGNTHYPMPVIASSNDRPTKSTDESEKALKLEIRGKDFHDTPGGRINLHLHGKLALGLVGPARLGRAAVEWRELPGEHLVVHLEPDPRRVQREQGRSHERHFYCYVLGKYFILHPPPIIIMHPSLIISHETCFYFYVLGKYSTHKPSFFIRCASSVMIQRV